MKRERGDHPTHVNLAVAIVALIATVCAVSACSALRKTCVAYGEETKLVQKCCSMVNGVCQQYCQEYESQQVCEQWECDPQYIEHGDECLTPEELAEVQSESGQ